MQQDISQKMVFNTASMLSSEVRELIVRRLMLLLYPPQSFLLLPLSKYKPVSSEVRELIVRRLIILVHRVQTIL